MISLIAAIGKNRELGAKNQLIFHIKEDMQFFRTTTTGHPVVMGKNTFASIGRPLPNRTNYVVTHHPEDLPDGVTPISDLAEFLTTAASDPEEYFVIGGATIYQTALPYAQTLYLTEIDATAPNADTFFPDFNKSDYTEQLIKEGKEDDLTFSIKKYIKHNG